MPTDPKYVMESQEEGSRLESKTDANFTREQLRQVRLATGMRVLDAGAATGAVARIMAELVGPDGRVCAMDRSEARLAQGRGLAEAAGITNLEFKPGDMEAMPFEDGTFDLSWSRFVFQYLGEPLKALKEMVRVTRVGGRVVVSDLDGYGINHWPVSERLERGLQVLTRSLVGRFDPLVGRKLFHLFRQVGLAEVKVHATPYHLYPGAAPLEHLSNWEKKLETIRPHVAEAFGGMDEYDTFARESLALLKDPDSFTYSVLITVEGTKVIPST